MGRCVRRIAAQPQFDLAAVRTVGVEDDLGGDPPPIDFPTDKLFPIVKFLSVVGGRDQYVLVTPYTWRREEVGLVEVLIGCRAAVVVMTVVVGFASWCSGGVLVARSVAWRLAFG